MTRANVTFSIGLAVAIVGVVLSVPLLALGGGVIVGYVWGYSMGRDGAHEA